MIITKLKERIFNSKLIIVPFEVSIILVISFLIYSVLIPKSASAAWFDDSWGYRKAIPINNTGSAQANVYVTLSSFDVSDTSKFQTDCDDIRFTKQNGELLPHLRPNSDCDSSTDFRILFDTLPVGNQTIYIYYGNPSIENGDSIFSASAASSTSVGTLASEEKSQGPVLYWSFDEVQGTTVKDLSFNNNDVSLSGAGRLTEDVCVSGRCLKFDGSDDYVDRGAKSWGFSTTATFSTWVKTSETNAAVISLGRGTTQDEMLLYIQSGKITIYNHTSGGVSRYRESGTAINDNNWHHVVGILNGGSGCSNLIVYVDGKREDGTCGTSGSPTDISDSTARNLRLANRHNATSTAETFSGLLDEIKVYNYALSQAQVQTNFNARFYNKSSGATLGVSKSLSTNQGLLAYWKMDETVGDTCNGAKDSCDASGNGNDGTWSGGATASATGKFGYGTIFDGTGDFIVTSTRSWGFTTSGTISAWIKTTESGAGTVFSLAHGTVQDEFLLYMASGKISIYQHKSSGNSWSKTSNSSVNTGSWVHVVGVMDGTGSDNLKIYVNGVQETGTGTTNGSPSALSDGTVRDARIGWRNNSGGSEDFNGQIDEVRLYNRALSPTEVSQIYNLAPPPVGYWKLDEGSGQNIYDSSGNGFTGTLGTSTSTEAIDPFWTTGKFGDALSSPGSGGLRAEIAHNAALDFDRTKGFSGSAWIYPTALSGTNMIISKEDGETDTCHRGWHIQGPGTDGTFYLLLRNCDAGSNSKTISTTTTFTQLNTWYHVAFTYDGSSTAAGMKIYINGIPQPTTEGGGTLSATIQNPRAVRIGGWYHTTYGGGTYSYSGKVDDVKLYNYTRTPKQVIEDMNGGHPSVGSPIGSALGHWKFDEGYGTIANNSGNQGNSAKGVITNAIWTGTGKYNKAVTFDGNDDYVTITDSGTGSALDVNQLSISTWIKISSTQADKMIAHKVNAYGLNLGYTAGGVGGESGKFGFHRFIGASWSTVNSTTTQASLLGQWVHLVGTWDGTESKLYINGQLEATTTNSTDTGTNNNNLLFSYSGTSGMSGSIDDFKLYNYALTASEVKTEYNQGQSQVLGALSDNTSGNQPNAANSEYCIPGDSSTCTSPTARWDFEQATGTGAFDSSGGGTTCTLTNGASFTSGKTGKGLNLVSSSSQYATCGTVYQPNNPITFEAWVYPTSLTADSVIISNDSLWTWYIRSFVGSTQLSIFKGPCCSTETWADYAFKTNTWYYLATTIDASGNAKHYVNGQLIANTLSNTFNLGTLANPFTIGKFNSTYFNGKLDNIRIFNYVRTPAQIAWGYNKGAPIAHYKLDECQGSVTYDSSGNGNTGTWSGSSSGTNTGAGTCASGTGAWGNGSGGKQNFSLHFDGTDDTVSIANESNFDFENTQPFSITAWVKGTSLTDYGVFVKMAHSAPFTGYDFRIFNGAPRLMIVNNWTSNAIDARSDKAIDDNQWHHVAATYNGSLSGANGVVLYVDAKPTSKTTPFDSLSGSILNNITPYIGSRNNQISYFPGQIDDVRIYNYVLTPNQVKTTMNQGGALRFGPNSGSP